MGWVARHAGEIISEISVAMAAGVGLGTIAKTIHPYPTRDISIVIGNALFFGRGRASALTPEPLENRHTVSIDPASVPKGERLDLLRQFQERLLGL